MYLFVIVSLDHFYGFHFINIYVSDIVIVACVARYLKSPLVTRTKLYGSRACSRSGLSPDASEILLLNFFALHPQISNFEYMASPVSYCTGGL